MTSSPTRSLSETPAPPARHSTKQRLLDAAESLFAQHGFEGTSMRAITQAAEANVSAANYHFGSKEALIQAALLRRIEPVNRRRLEALDVLEAEVSDAEVPVEALLDAFLRPGFEAQRESRRERLPYRSVAAQLYSDPHPMVTSLKALIFGPVIGRYIDALARALPGREREELVLDFQFFIGVMIHVISGEAGRETAAGEAPAAPDDELLRRMVAFAAAGIRAGTADDDRSEGRGGSR